MEVETNGQDNMVFTPHDFISFTTTTLKTGSACLAHLRRFMPSVLRDADSTDAFVCIGPMEIKGVSFADLALGEHRWVGPSPVNPAPRSGSAQHDHHGSHTLPESLTSHIDVKNGDDSDEWMSISHN
jgi:hypothetical protein